MAHLKVQTNIIDVKSTGPGNQQKLPESKARSFEEFTSGLDHCKKIDFAM